MVSLNPDVSAGLVQAFSLLYAYSHNHNSYIPYWRNVQKEWLENKCFLKSGQLGLHVHNKGQNCRTAKVVWKTDK